MKKKANRKKLETPAKLKIDRTAPYDPAQHNNSSETYTIWRGPKDGEGLVGEEEQDSRSLLITELDPALLVKLSGLEEDETTVSTEIRYERVLPKGIHLDAKIVEALIKEKGQITLEWLYRALGVECVEFLGTTLRGNNGYRYSLCVTRDNGEPRDYGNKSWDAHAHLRAGTWESNICWLGYERDTDIPVLCLPLLS
jgi:hypothetical protein